MESEEKTRLAERISLFGLLFACPFDQGNPGDCQLHRIRLLSPRERVEWIRGLSDAEAARFLQAHRECLCHKESHPD